MRKLDYVGKTIKIIEMKDEPSYTGKIVTITHRDGLGQFHRTWGSLAIIPEVDKYEILEDKK